MKKTRIVARASLPAKNIVIEKLVGTKARHHEKGVLFFLLWMVLLVVPIAGVAQDVQSWEDWLRFEGYYLLNSEQKEEFAKLNNAEKQRFVNNLWAQLDPDPITPRNEFYDEYIKRVRYARKHYGIPSDRAKIYILLGAPNAVDSHPSSDIYYPLELWSYYSLGYRELPPSLDLIFFKRWGVGDYRLYSPIFDGLKALTPRQIDTSTPRMRAEMKGYFDPGILRAAEGVAPGANVNESEVVRMLLQAPNAMQKILIQSQRPTVETTVVYHQFEAQVSSYSVPQDTGAFRTSIALAIPPKYLTFQKDDDVYQSRIDLIGKLTDEKGNVILQLNDSPYMKLTASEFEKAKSYLFSYLFEAFLLPGRYSFECLYRDYASNSAGKVEQSIQISSTEKELYLLPPLLAFKTAAAANDLLPFAYDGRQYFPKENGTFNSGQNVILHTTLMNPQKKSLDGIWQVSVTLKKGQESVWQSSEDIPLASSRYSIDLARSIQLQDLAPGSYELTVQMVHDNMQLESQAPITIGRDPEVLGRLRFIAESALAPETFHTNLAMQYFYRNQLDDASRHVRIAMDFAPSSYPAKTLNARIEKAKGNTDTAIELYEKLLEGSPDDGEGWFLVGTWYQEKGDWSRALDRLTKAMDAGYYTTDVLNKLARTQVQLGNNAKAVELWKQSLALNSEQPEIQKEIETHRQ